MQDFSKSIFKILTAGGSGTGFYFPEKDLYITNFHVVAGQKEVALQNQSRERFLGKVVYVNQELDLAFIRSDFRPSAGPYIQMDPALPIKGLQQMYVHGFPFGMPYTVTKGVISSPSQVVNGRTYIQTDAAVNPGNSGGPMLTADGFLIGVTTSKFTQADNTGFGIPVKNVVEELNEFTAPDFDYHVKCDSCGSLIKEETEFCPKCGNDIDPVVFREHSLSYFARFVEQALRQEGFNPVLARMGRDFWEYHEGSALIRIFVFKHDYLVATSPLNRLPKENLEVLYEYLVSDEQHVKPYYLGISENYIYLSYRVHLSDIFSEKKHAIAKELGLLPKTADRLDNFFVEKFGCRLSNESRDVEA